MNDLFQHINIVFGYTSIYREDHFVSPLNAITNNDEVIKNLEECFKSNGIDTLN